jgi:hypothetical protein
MQGSLEDNNGYPEVFFMQHWGLFYGFNGENVQFWPNFFNSDRGRNNYKNRRDGCGTWFNVVFWRTLR